MRKLLFLASPILATLCIGFCILYFMVSTQVVDRFGYVEKTTKQQLIFENIRLFDIFISKYHYITFVFSSDQGMKIKNRKFINNQKGRKVYFYWSLRGKRFDYYHYYAKDEVMMRRGNWVFDALIKQKINANKK